MRLEARKIKVVGGNEYGVRRHVGIGFEQELDGSAAAVGRQTAPLAMDASFGTSPRMKEIQALIAQVGWSDAPILIQGESGVGKEVLARMLHARSPRAHRPFIKLNCAALPSELVESELFGYERGAFTGAFQKKGGLFERADAGTLLLDEIGDMDYRLQAKLLQVLQDNEFHRLGGRETIRVDVRIMSATHKDLETAICCGGFRADLYYRLNVITLCLPALRERKDEIVPLAELFLRKHAAPGVPIPALTPALEESLLSYSWPGNIRELENVMRRLAIFGDADALACELRSRPDRRAMVSTSAQVPPADADCAGGNSSFLQQVLQVKEQAEIKAIIAALNSTHWNRKQAALMLKIDYKALLYKMKRLGIGEKVVPFLTGTVTQ